MPDEISVNFASAANKSILAYLGITQPDQAVAYGPKEVNIMGLGTHPDLATYLWGLARDLHPGCACVVNRTSKPLLVNPESGVIFGLAGGTSTLALRLPEPERAEMLAVPGYGAKYAYPHSTVYAKDIGEDWVLIRPFQKDNAALCQKAFAYAGTLK
jgi:hypothetical protein